MMRGRSWDFRRNSSASSCLNPSIVIGTRSIGIAHVSLVGSVATRSPGYATLADPLGIYQSTIRSRPTPALLSGTTDIALQRRHLEDVGFQRPDSLGDRDRPR